MADKVVSVDVRSLVVTWPENAPRGAVARFCREHDVSRSWSWCLRSSRPGAADRCAVRDTARPRRATRSPQAIPFEVEELALAIRKELADQGWDHGPVTVRHKLLELGIAAPATSTLARSPDRLQVLAADRAHSLIWDRCQHVLRLRAAFRDFFPAALEGVS